MGPTCNIGSRQVSHCRKLFRLLGWKQLYESKGGRLTLLKSTLSNLPTDFVSLFAIPMVVANKLESSRRNFLSRGSDKFELPIVNMNTRCFPILNGGLRVAVNLWIICCNPVTQHIMEFYFLCLVYIG